MVGQRNERDYSEVTILRKESRWVPYAKKFVSMKTHGLKTTASMGRQEQGSMGSLVCPLLACRLGRKPSRGPGGP